MTHRVPTGVGWTVDRDDGGTRVYVARLPHGPIHVLDGTAALIWLEALREDPSDLSTRVATAAGVPEEALGDDVTRFVADLVARGLLTT